MQVVRPFFGISTTPIVEESACILPSHELNENYLYKNRFCRQKTRMTSPLTLNPYLKPLSFISLNHHRSPPAQPLTIQKGEHQTYSVTAMVSVGFRFTFLLLLITILSSRPSSVQAGAGCGKTYRGTCIDVNYACCAVGTISGRCPGPSNIRCCRSIKCCGSSCSI